MCHLFLLAFVTLLQTPPVQPTRPATLAEDVGRLASSATNDERFDALTTMLRARNLTFTVEPFTIEKPIGREPRTDARNIVVTRRTALTSMGIRNLAASLCVRAFATTPDHAAGPAA